MRLDNLLFLRNHVHAQTGIVLDACKHYLFESRLAPIAKKFGLATIDDLCAVLRAGVAAEIGREVAEAMTTNETYFFREATQFDAIRAVLLPGLKKRRDSEPLRFWSAAASTGQEAYSLAMLLLEEGLDESTARIYGTDISSQAIGRASAGRYLQIEVNRGLPGALLERYFRRCGPEWQLLDRARRLVRFEPADLRRAALMPGQFDLVFCRNVLIYFDAETKVRVLEVVRRSLRPGGWLFLGGSEILPGVGDLYRAESVGGTTVYVAV
jgi:chemotaxis protein methyltransferase CheR